MSAQPQVLKNCNAFIDGVGYAGHVIELEPPKMTIKEEEHRAGGMDVPVGQDMGMEKLEAKAVISKSEKALQGLFGKPGVTVIFRGAYVEQGGKVVAAVHTCTGKMISNESGAWKPGEKDSGNITAMFSLEAYKYEIDGQVIYDIDALNMKRVIDGEDQLEAQRAAIGL